MPRQAPDSRRRIPRWSPSIRAAAQRRCQRTFALCSKAHCRSALVLAVALVAGCRTVPTATADAGVAARARLIRIEDTRRIDAVFLDSALRASDGSLRRAAAL